ncbi:MAG: tRNA epoxyqueuosine(34) reductase QueG [Acidobacteria bacterium]|nr:tRNA epoxyqueuosine(34) reductase QueG [Acidobacteriota bacterium]MCA1649052.1 tRNA epoxyqueuosine(34) reductase QueG [Acidobacteriota bacterium]
MDATYGVRALTSAELKEQAALLGFDLCGIAPAADHAELRFLEEWLARGYAGEMHYLHRSAERRRDVRAVLPSAQCVIALATIYNSDRPYSTDNVDPTRAAIARYAWGTDYHTVIQERLDRLLAWLHERVGGGFEGRAYVDTGPVQERVYAQHAGIGWVGKNTCLINADIGSWIFLSEIICNLPLQPDPPALDQCGACTLCLDSCPTGALVEPRVLDSTKCLSYLTIELKGAIPVEQRDAVGEHAYGCDICQDVCPWNLTRSTAVSSEPTWSPRAGFDGPPALLELWLKKDDELKALLKGSAMRRAGVRRLRRNLAVAIGNSGHAEAAEALATSAEPTVCDPLVSEHVEWAMEKLRG